MSDKARKIRAYKDSDKQTFLEIYDAAIPPVHDFIEENVRLKQRQTAEDLLDKPNTETFVVEENGQVAGFAIFISKTAMAGFFIHPKMEGKGLGRYLMEYIQRNKRVIKLAVYKRNRKAKRFYKKNGFHQTGNEREKDTNQEYLEMIWNASE